MTQYNMHLSDGIDVAVCASVFKLLSSQVMDKFIQTKLTYLMTQFLHHVNEKVIKLFALNVAIICQRKVI